MLTTLNRKICWIVCLVNVLSPFVLYNTYYTYIDIINVRINVYVTNLKIMEG